MLKLIFGFLTGSPAGLGVAGGIWLASLLGAGYGVWYVTSDHYVAKEARALQTQIEAFKSDSMKLNQIAAAQLAKERANVKTVYQPIFHTITKVVEKPVYQRACIDADGLRLLNAAVAGKPPDAGQPDAAVRARDAARSK